MKTVISGLEGASKSQKANQIAVEIATIERPVLFAYKNYHQLRENYEKLIDKNKVNPREICVCGVTKDNPEAMMSYTNPEKPKYIRHGTKYVMCVQALLQRGLYKKFYPEKNYKLIIVDEFDFRLVTIPTLDYQLSRVADSVNKEKFVEDVLEWVDKSYADKDYDRIIDLPYREVPERYKKFVKTSWLEEEQHKTIFLTSEVLSTKFLQLLGFKNQYLKSPDFKDRIINTQVSEDIVSEFYEVMNDESYWYIFDKHYDLVASDKCKKTEGETLVNDQDIRVLNHTVVKGTNNYIGKKMLTILSHVPPQVIDEIYDMFMEFGKYEKVQITKDEVYTLFYRDRACQAVGRVLGNRGGKETDLLVNRRIYTFLNKYEEFPYTLNADYKLPCKELDEVLEKTKQLKQKNREYRKEKQKIKIEKKYEMGVSKIDEHFIKRTDAKIMVKELKEYLLTHDIKSKYGKKNIPINKLIEYFQVEMKQITWNGKRERFVIGLDYVNKVNINPETREITEV